MKEENFVGVCGGRIEAKAVLIAQSTNLVLFGNPPNEGKEKSSNIPIFPFSFPFSASCLQIISQRKFTQFAPFVNIKWK